MADELEELREAMRALYEKHRVLYRESVELVKEFERLRHRANELRGQGHPQYQSVFTEDSDKTDDDPKAPSSSENSQSSNHRRAS